MLPMPLLLFTLFCRVVYSDASCFCGYRRSGMLITLRCVSDPAELPRLLFTPVICERMGGIVRIGDSTSVIAIREETGALGMAIEPYGLSQLEFSEPVIKLQLNFPLQAKLLDALAFAGLHNLVTLHVWRAPIALDGCSLAGLPRLENIVLSCGSTFSRFITFGSSFKSIRLIGCLGRPLQFICTQCTQRPDISVLRILPGPPSPGGIVTFESWWNSSFQTENSGALGKCRPGVCSDDHICRYNYPLKLARGYQPRKPLTYSTPVPLKSPDPSESAPFSFFSIFLPILGFILVISIALCLFMSLRISERLRRKRKVVHLEGRGGNRQNLSAPTESDRSLSVLLNRSSSINKT
ncbi:hypothetical protein ACTXT7_016877 [Hymenolepis weldensis]